MRTLALAALSIAFLLAYAIGLRDWWLLMAGFLGMVPIQTIVTLITVRLFSVEFEPTGEVHDILHPADSHTANAEAEQTNVPRREPIAIRLWEFFKGINQPRTVEGYAIQAGIVVIAVFVAWMSALPLLRSVFPEFDASRSGPKGFPVTAEIGESTLAVTNGSDAFWTCRAELGNERLAGAFEVIAGKTTQISLVRFDPNGTLDRSQIRNAAQNRIWLVCDEPSGVSHAAYLR
jgi:hypothetical protein